MVGWVADRIAGGAVFGRQTFSNPSRSGAQPRESWMQFKPGDEFNVEIIENPIQDFMTNSVFLKKSIVIDFFCKDILHLKTYSQA